MREISRSNVLIWVIRVGYIVSIIKTLKSRWLFQLKVMELFLKVITCTVNLQFNTSMQRFLKLFWVITCIAFMVVLFYVYAYLSETLTVANEMTFGRSEFFYLLLGVFGVLALLLYAIRRFFELHPSFENDTTTFQTDLVNWLISFSGVVNVVLILGMVFVAIDNNPDGMRHRIPSFIVYFGPALIGIWAVLLVVVLGKKVMARD